MSRCTRATVDTSGGHACAVAELRGLLVDLQHKLASRRQDNGEGRTRVPGGHHLCLSCERTVEDRQEVAERLAAARLGDGDNIAPVVGNRPALRLDGGRVAERGVPQLLQQLGVEGRVREPLHRLPALCAVGRRLIFTVVRLVLASWRLRLTDHREGDGV